MIGRVIAVRDGDSIVIRDATNAVHRIRLAGIDAPEIGQAGGSDSRERLRSLIFDRTVTVTWLKQDKYGRLVGVVRLGGVDVCLEQLRTGMAWHYKRFEGEQTLENRALYANSETEARSSRIGLWAAASPVAPWDFRRRRP